MNSGKKQDDNGWLITPLHIKDIGFVLLAEAASQKTPSRSTTTYLGVEVLERDWIPPTSILCVENITETRAAELSRNIEPLNHISAVIIDLEE